MLVEKQRSYPVVETDERTEYEAPAVEDIEATEGPAATAAGASGPASE